MKKRYFLWGAFGGALLVLLTFLFPLRTPERPVLCPVRVAVHPDGSVQFSGEDFSDHMKLKVRLTAFRGQHSNCFMSAIADNGTRPDVIESAFGVFRAAGFSSVGFITEPRPVTNR